MGSNTIMLEWQQLRDQLDAANVRDQENVWKLLLEHETYMQEKGYEITFSHVTTPEGEVVWERS